MSGEFNKFQEKFSDTLFKAFKWLLNRKKMHNKTNIAIWKCIKEGCNLQFTNEKIWKSIKILIASLLKDIYALFLDAGKDL